MPVQVVNSHFKMKQKQMSFTQKMNENANNTAGFYLEKNTNLSPKHSIDVKPQNLELKEECTFTQAHQSVVSQAN